MFNLKKHAYILLIGLVTLVASYFIFGFYYERYEPFLVALMSGKLTPTMIYDDLFYLAHILIVKIYAQLFTLFPSIPWLSIFQYLYLFLAYWLLGDLLKTKTKFKGVFTVTLLVFSILFMEYYVIHVMTRISYLLAFVSLMKVIQNFQLGNRKIKYNFLYFLLFLLAVLIRSEPPTVVLLIVAIYYFLVVNREIGVLQKVKSSFMLFLIPGIFSLVAIIWVAVSIQTSDEFYIKIEPDVEYELTARNNIIDISNMTTKVDSLRYEAIYLGIWGDATTNDDLFLRSLIDSKVPKFNELYSNAMNGIWSSIVQCWPIFVFNTALFLLLFLGNLRKDSWRSIKLLLFHLSFYFVIFLFGYKVKMIVTSLSPLLFGVSMLYLVLFFELNKKRTPILFFVIISITAGMQLYFLNYASKIKQIEYEKGRVLINNIESTFPNKNIFFDEITLDLTLKGFKPFQTLEINNVQKIYAYDNQHTTTIQPYKTYLAKDCNCDPNNYEEYFRFIQEGGEQNVFFVANSKAKFMQEYLEVVHLVKTSWLPLKQSTIPDCAFYQLKFHEKE